jgi:magnesium-transporting ATPase (P-type)
MSLYQSAVVLIIAFSGEDWIPESQSYTPRNDDYIVSGRLYSWDGDDSYKLYRDSNDDPGPSRQFAIVFTVFVLMQVFNMLNVRKINDEINIFYKLHKSYIFLIIWASILVVQVLITQFTQDVFFVCRDGLEWHQWLICFAFGASVIPIDFAIKFIPDAV